MSIHDRIASAYMADVSAPSSAFAVATRAGKIVAAYSVIYGAITVANSLITMKINGVAVTHPTWTIAYSGSAAGDMDSTIPTAANTVAAGDRIEFISDGGSTTTAPVMFSAVIK